MQARMQLLDGVDVRQVDAFDQHLHAIFGTQGIGQGLQAIQAAGDEYECPATGGILASELFAEAARGAGDQYPRCGGGRHETFLVARTKKRMSAKEHSRCGAYCCCQCRGWPSD